MSPTNILSMFGDTLTVVLMMLAVLIIPGLVVGLLVAKFQAATQINEMSLSFIPKLFVTFLVIMFAGPWLVKTLINFTEGLVNNIPYMIG